MTEQRILTRGSAAILYDARVAGKIGTEMFDPAYWHERGQVLGEASGRGTTLYLSAGDEQWVLRPYRRGGLIGRFIHSRYLYTGRERTRCFREFCVLSDLRALRLPVPAPVAAWYRRAGPSYEAALITLRIPDTLTLAQILKKAPLAPENWLAIGRALRRFHSAGLRHADLNAHNILINSNAEVFLVDMDRARLVSAGRWQSANLARLRRSLNKISMEEGAEFGGDADWAALMAGYHHEDSAST
jgi:3-deoxy-D-manno-octulosonic acid kinase